MKIFLEYVRHCLKPLLIFLIFSGIFALVFFIYHSDTEAVMYAFLICSAIGIIYTAIDFSFFKRKHMLLHEIYENLPLMTEKLPDSENIIQEDLYDIIRKLHQINNTNINQLKNIQRNNSEYFTVWVHQIKTPISAMQMILQSEDTDTSRELSAELFRIEQYAEMALYYIRLDSSSDDLIIKNYKLDSVMKQAVRRYAPLFIRRRIKLDYQPTDAEVLTDEKWLVFVVEQLLSNAVKYTINGSVSVGFADDVLYVSDTGIGIAPEDLPRIFEKGYTGMGGRTDRKSTGLGLYLCKKVCDKLGHKISVKSEIGKGSIFSVDLSVERFDIE